MDRHLSVSYLGHATLLIEMDGIRILTDPTIRERIGPLERQSPHVPHAAYEGIHAVLISHLHHDHLDFASLRRLHPVPRLIVPLGAGPLLREAGYRDVDEFEPGGQTTHGPLRIRATAADHSGFRLPFGPTAVALGFVIESSARRVYFAGDTDLFPAMAGISPDGLDLALLPVWGWGPTLGPGHMDPVRAAEALRLLRPREAAPIHWGTFWPRGMGRVRPDRLRQPAHDFAVAAAELAPEVRIAVTSPGHQIHLHGR